MEAAARIDVHQHLIPPEFREALDRHGVGGWAPFPWSEAGALALMAEFGIETGMLSLSTPGPHLGDDAEARVLAKAINERIAEMVRMRPDRFGLFASVALPDVDGSLEAIAYAYDELSADGVVLLANTHGTYLGDPRFDPVMAELDRRDVDADETLAGLSSFYFDTALAGSPTALPSLHAFARPGHVLFGTDNPYCASPTAARFTGTFDAYEGFDDTQRHAINRANAAALFPRLHA